MVSFRANSPKQLDLCLRMLYAEGMNFVVVITETNKGRIVYDVQTSADGDRKIMLEERYRILIS